MKIYKCNKCGNIIEIIKGKNETITCCGELMEEIIPQEEGELAYKHVPSVMRNGKRVFVSVGEAMHPMDEDHYIEYIACEYPDQFIKTKLNPGEEPVTSFDYETGMKIYAYCNEHGLWVKEV